MTLASIIALAGLAGSPQAGDQPRADVVPAAVRFQVPKLTWPRSQSINLFGLRHVIPGVKVAATTTTREDKRSPICTMRLMPADPDLDRHIVLSTPGAVDQNMVVNSRCRATPNDVRPNKKMPLTSGGPSAPMGSSP